MKHPKSPRTSVLDENRQRYTYAVGVFAVCVMGDWLISYFPQLSEARRQNDAFLVALSVIIFCVGFAHIRHGKAAARDVKVAAASEFAQTASIANEGEYEAKQAANMIIYHSTSAQARWQIQAEDTTPMAPPEVERAASQAAQTADLRTESPQKPRKAPKYVSRSSAGSRVPTESEDNTNKALEGNSTEQTHHRAYDRYPLSHPAPRDILYTATVRTPLRREASAFVPNEWVFSWQMPPQTSMLCNRAPYSLSQYDEFLQTGMQQMGSQCDERTTVMLKNIPCPFLREDLIKEMDAKGFAGLYNYVYIPVDFQTQMSRGYGFVNLISAEETHRFILAFDGFRGWPLPSSKICSVELARVQGLDNNVWIYRNSAIMGDEVPERFRPVLFDGTERVPFPEPTGELPKVVRCAQNLP